MALPPTLALVYHIREPYPREVPLAEVYRHLDLVPPPDRPAVILNMVQTLDGVLAIEGKAWGIGSEVDHFLFRTLHGWADAVLSGSGTLRLNDVIPLTHPHLTEDRLAAGRPPHPTAVVVSRQAEFPDAVLRKRFFAQQEFPSVVITTELAREADRRRIEAAGAEVLVVPATPSGEVDLAGALGLLRERGVQRVVAEGGPGMNRHLADARALDELTLTLTTQIAGAPDPRRLTAGLFGGAVVPLAVLSEYQYRAPEVREWYLRFATAW